MPSLSTIKSQPLRWLWPNHFPLGKLSLLVAEQGAGKTFVALDLAARVSAGLPWPLLPETANPAGGVLLLTAADDLSDITCPRLAAAGADLNRVSTPESPQPAESTPSDDNNHESPAQSFDLTALEQEIKSMPNCRLVVIDPLSDFLPATMSRSKRPDWPSIFKTLAAIAARTGVAIVATLSFIPSTSAAANHRAVATLAAHPGPACVWRVAIDPQNEDHRTLLPIKNNLAPRNAPLAFELAAQPAASVANVVWKDASYEPELPPSRGPKAGVPTARPAPPVPAGAASPPAPQRAQPASPPTQPSPRQAHPSVSDKTLFNATCWLVGRLKNGGGQLSASKIRKGAEFDQIPPHVLNLAKDTANILTVPSNPPGDEIWKLP